MVQTYWNGYKKYTFVSEGKESCLLCPHRPRRERPLLISSCFPGEGLLQKGVFCFVSGEDANVLLPLLKELETDFRLQLPCYAWGEALFASSPSLFRGVLSPCGLPALPVPSLVLPLPDWSEALGNFLKQNHS